MDRQQAVTILGRKTTIPGDGYTWEQINEAIDIAITALSPPNEPLTIEQLRAELEQVKRCIEIVENQRDQMKRERDAAIDCIYKIEDALDRGNDNDWAREHISEWESQKED